MLKDWELPQFYLPDLLAKWPWARSMNQHYELKSAFDEWFRGFEVLEAESQGSFDRCNFALLSSLGCPFLDKDGLRVTCDLMALFFIYDEYTDKLDEDGARPCAVVVMDALRNPHKERPQGESKLGEITRQFWLRATKVASEAAQRRFLKSFALYAYAVVEEASDRNGGRVRGIKDYLELRRHSAAVYITFHLELGLDIPDEIMTHPAMESLFDLFADIILLTNDLYSYNIEQAAGHGGHNILTAVMNEKGVDLDGALNWFAEYIQVILLKFQAHYRMLPSWGPDMDPIVTTFVERMAYWVRGHDCWSFESERYFGTKGPEIQKHRLVTLLPRKPDVTPMMVLQ